MKKLNLFRYLLIGVLFAALAGCNLPSGNPNTQATLAFGVTQAVEQATAGTPFPTVLPANSVTPRPTDPPLALTLAASATAPTGSNPSPTAPAAATSVPTSASSPTPGPTPTLPPRVGFNAVQILSTSDGLNIDGLPNDWPELPYTVSHVVFRPENWTGPDDNSARFALAWDSTYLYVIIEVTDDVLVQTQTDVNLFRGDSVEILLDADLFGDLGNTTLTRDDYQLGLSPGNFSGSAPEAWLWFPRDITGRPANIILASQTTSIGYNIEAAVPWAVFAVNPSAGLQLGFALSVSDNDLPGTANQQSMISSVNPRRLTDPTSWGVLTLDP